jgi:hypothetical protein
VLASCQTDVPRIARPWKKTSTPPQTKGTDPATVHCHDGQPTRRQGLGKIRPTS